MGVRYLYLNWDMGSSFVIFYSYSEYETDSLSHLNKKGIVFAGNSDRILNKRYLWAMMGGAWRKIHPTVF